MKRRTWKLRYQKQWTPPENLLTEGWRFFDNYVGDVSFGADLIISDLMIVDETTIALVYKINHKTITTFSEAAIYRYIVPLEAK